MPTAPMDTSTPITELRAGGAWVRIAPALGARLTAACLAGANGEAVPVLHPYPESVVDLLPWAKGGLYPLIPYSGRIGHARLVHEGAVVELAPHPGGEPHTLHGISQQRPWTLGDASGTTAALRYRHEPDRHWPWRFEAGLDIALAPQRLSIGISLVNLDARSMPAGIGAHPYVPYKPGDSVAFAAGPAWPFDADFLAQRPEHGDRQQQGFSIPAARLEAEELTLFHGDWTGELRLQHRDGSVLRFTADAGLRHLVLHRPAAAPYLCIEPVSHVADGFNLHARGVGGTGTRILAPGEAMNGRLEIASEAS